MACFLNGQPSHYRQRHLNGMWLDLTIFYAEEKNWAWHWKPHSPALDMLWLALFSHNSFISCFNNGDSNLPARVLVGARDYNQICLNYSESWHHVKTIKAELAPNVLRTNSLMVTAVVLTAWIRIYKKIHMQTVLSKASVNFSSINICLWSLSLYFNWSFVYQNGTYQLFVVMVDISGKQGQVPSHLSHTGQKSTIHQVTTMLTTSKMSNFQVITTC